MGDFNISASHVGNVQTSYNNLSYSIQALVGEGKNAVCLCTCY